MNVFMNCFNRFSALLHKKCVFFGGMLFIIFKFFLSFIKKTYHCENPFYCDMNPIISVEELSSSVINTIFLDARTGVESYQNYLEKHISGARFVDLDTHLAKHTDDASQGGRHPLPTLEDFARTVSILGLSKEQHIVIYDTANGANAAARCWWMLSAFGFENVQVLSGGLATAEKAGLPLSKGEEQWTETEVKAPKIWGKTFVNIDEVEQHLKSSSSVVIDVRDTYRYRGESEPIDLVAGHIPGAINIPFSENLNAQGEFLSKEELYQKYHEKLGRIPENIILHCGSGVTACHTLLAMESAGLKNTSLYVGSWSEWSRRTDKPIVTE